MESPRNLTGRRSDSDSRIQLREGLWDSVGYPVRKSRCENNLAQAVWRATLAGDENHREIDRLSQIGLWRRLLISEIPLSAFHFYPNPPFFPQPPFPRLWSGYQIFQRPSLQKQIPRNTTPARPSGCSKMERTASSANTIPKGCCWRRGMRWTMPTNKES